VNKEDNMHFFSEIASTHTNLLPESLMMYRIFEQTVPAAGFYLNPAGGEQYGTLSVASISTKVTQEIDEAILALWKVSYCFREEIPYEKWDRAEIIRAKDEYEDSYKSWLKCESQKDFLNWLKTNANNTICAQRELSKPFNQPIFLSDKNTVTAANLELLDYVNLEYLFVVLNNIWYDTTGLFKYRQYWFLVSWGTSA